MNKRPGVAVDAIVLRDDGSFVLIKRRRPPFQGFFALPGGAVEYGETVEGAVVREVREETGLDVRVEKIAGVYSEPGRDPRGHVISIAFICRETGGELMAGSDAKEVAAFRNIPEKIAFDHKKILKEAGY